VWGAAAAAWAGKVYLAGGDADFFFGGPSDQVDIYDIAAGTWSTGDPLPVGVSAMGFVQTGPWLYLAGGWGELAPTANITATQRYDLVGDAWDLGPEFNSARADFALAATSQSLYAIGGDNDGGGPFDATDLVESLDLRRSAAGTAHFQQRRILHLRTVFGRDPLCRRVRHLRFWGYRGRQPLPGIRQRNLLLDLHRSLLAERSTCNERDPAG
jgi:hypothetical protein